MKTSKSTPLTVLFKRINEAKSFKELLDGDNSAKAYRRLAKLVHPDVVPKEMEAAATIVFSKLLSLYNTLNGHVTSPAATVIAGYVIKSTLAKGDICDLYLVESVRDDNAVLKIVRNERDNDLLEREIASLKYFHGRDHHDSSYEHYVPKILNSFKASGRRVVVLPYVEGYLSLRDILALYPNGLDFRHIIWMGNRLMSILGYIHILGIIHGAILPSHLLYHPLTHDLRLIDWCYSAKGGGTIPAVVKINSNFYPPEVKRKIEAIPATDIYMMANTLLSAAQTVPARFNSFFEYCTAGSPASRPSDAWALQDTWTALAQSVYGAPTYIPLEIKSN